MPKRDASLRCDGDVGPESRLGWSRGNPAGGHAGGTEDRQEPRSSRSDDEEPERWDGLS